MSPGGTQVMATSERDVIDFSALERELQAAVESERRHRRENDAKLRAVGQRVATYREFRDLVLACHLKPLDKKIKTELHGNSPGTPSPRATSDAWSP